MGRVVFAESLEGVQAMPATFRRMYQKELRATADAPPPPEPPVDEGEPN